jgi:hypothetical protein
MPTDQESTLISLKDEGTNAWLEYLRLAKEDSSKRTLSMDVVFQYVAPRAKQQESLEWGEIAIRAMDLEAESSEGSARENSLLRGMELRSWFIARRGSVAGDVVLDKETILQWVEDGLCLTRQAVEEKAKSIWDDVAKVKTSQKPEEVQRIGDTLRQLSRIKHRLRVASVLADCGELPENSGLWEWLPIADQLP